MTMYLAMTSPTTAPLLARSRDGGAHFDVKDLEPSLGKGLLRIIAIDPDDPERVLLRFNGANEQAIALTTDGGATATKPVVVNGNFTSFVRLPSGRCWSAAMVDYAVVPGLYRSRDRGDSFERLPTPPSIRALSQRDGVVYAATDNFGDGYAAGTSADEGDTWQPLLRYEQVRAIIPCLMSRCQATCQTEVDLGLWPQEVCAATVPTMMGAAGSSGVGGGAGGAGARGGVGGPGSPSAPVTATAPLRRPPIPCSPSLPSPASPSSSSFARGSPADAVDEDRPRPARRGADLHAELGQRRRVRRDRDGDRVPRVRRQRRHGAPVAGPRPAARGALQYVRLDR